MLFETYLSWLKLGKHFARKHGLSYSSLFLSFFQAGIWVAIVFNISNTCPFFPILSLFMNNFCIAHAFFLQLKLFKRDIYKNLEHLSYQAYFCVYSQYRSRTFLGGWKTCWCACTQVGRICLMEQGWRSAWLQYRVSRSCEFLPRHASQFDL